MTYKVTLNGKVYEVAVEQGEAIMVDVSDAAVAAAAPVPAAPVPAASAAVASGGAPAPAASASGEVVASPLPGNVLAVKVAPGEAVKKGQLLVVVEAMKMENDVLSPRDGTVAQIIAAKGAVVETGAPLLTLQ